ncbi:MAG: hypothetical protein P8X82_19265 [Gemmatimonadales bacterium]
MLVVSEKSQVDSFGEFFAEVEPRLRHALAARYGPEVGRESAADAFEYAWSHWGRVGSMKYPLAYLFRVGQSAAKRYRKRLSVKDRLLEDPQPWFEPALTPALSRLSQALESVAPPLGVEEVSSPRPLRVAPPSEAMWTVGSRRGWVVALGASALTLLLLGGVCLFGMLQPGPPAGESLSADPVVWSRLDDPALGVPGAVGDVQSFSIGLVAVGSAQDETGRSSPAVWLQDEDGAWSRVGVATFDGLSGELRAVAEHSGRLVVVGTDNASSVPAHGSSLVHSTLRDPRCATSL